MNGLSTSIRQLGWNPSQYLTWQHETRGEYGDLDMYDGECDDVLSNTHDLQDAMPNLPAEILRIIFKSLEDSVKLDTLKAVRLTRKRLSEVAAPILFNSIRLAPHMYFLDRLTLDLEINPSFRYYVRTLVLDVAWAADVAGWFNHASRKPGFNKRKFQIYAVQSPVNRVRMLQQVETESLVRIFNSLPNLQCIDLVLDSGGRFEKDGRLGSLHSLLDELHVKEDMLENRIDWNSWRWHHTEAAMFESTVYALDRFPALKAIKARDINAFLVHEEFHAEEYRKALHTLHKIVSRLESFWLGLRVCSEDYYDEFWNEDRDKVHRVRRDSFARLVRHASHCTDLRMMKSYQASGIDDHELPLEESALHFFRDLRQTPTLPRLKTIYLFDISLWPEDLLSFLTIHCPAIQDVSLLHLTPPRQGHSPVWSERERFDRWTAFFKQLKAGTNLTSLRFFGLFGWSYPGARVFEHPEELFEWKAPELYNRTIQWFLDKSLDDDLCPLNSFEAAETRGEGVFNCWLVDRPNCKEVFQM